MAAGCGTAATSNHIRVGKDPSSSVVVNCGATLAEIQRTARTHPEDLTPAAKRALKLLAQGKPDPQLCASGTNTITTP